MNRRNLPLLFSAINKRSHTGAGDQAIETHMAFHSLYAGKYQPTYKWQFPLRMDIFFLVMDIFDLFILSDPTVQFSVSRGHFPPTLRSANETSACGTSSSSL
jgi:hypothetical protein